MDEYWNSGERRGRQGSEEEYTLKLPHFERREERYRTYRAEQYGEEPYIPLSQRNAGRRRSSRQNSRRDSRAESSRHTYRSPAGRGSGGNRRRRRGRSGMPGWAKVLCAVGAVLLLLAVAGLMYYNYLLGLVDMKKEDDYAVEETTDTLQEPDPLADFDPSSVVWDQNTVYRQEDGVLNFLLIGEENMDDNARGRADAIMIATIN